MSTLLEEIKEHARVAGLIDSGLDDIDVIHVGPGALGQLSDYLARKGMSSVLMAVDKNTYRCAGEIVHSMLRNVGVKSRVTLLEEDAKGDVIANEPSLIQLILDVQRYRPQILLAVGGGTIHDITRFAAYTASIDFVSVPTAPSVDGFNSKGAPVIIRGEKITVPAICPSAVFADTDILMKAPSELVAAGFGDMLGKYTSLFDWKFGSVTAGEPYMELAADLTKSALQSCINHVDGIADRTEEGITVLTEALIQSGLAMLLFGQSHPASGAEHHVSHYWEVEYIRLGNKQLLHGAKVGVASVEIARLYLRLAEEGYVRWGDIVQELRRLPDPQTLSVLLSRVGGPSSTAELGISHELLDRALREAHQVRNQRHTLLRAYNERSRKQTWGDHAASVQ